MNVIYKTLLKSKQGYHDWLLDHVKHLRKVAYKKFLKLVRANKLPVDFDMWDLCDEHGWTIAHEAVRRGYLPSTFDKWRLRDKYGWTIAHEAKRCGHLPDDFDQWDIIDYNKRVKNHAAAQYYISQKNFDQ